MAQPRASLQFLSLSLALHLGLGVAIWRVPRLPSRAMETPTIDLLEGWEPEPGEPTGEAHRGAATPSSGGRRVRSNIDTDRRGARGDGRATGPVILLMPRADDVTLSDAVPNVLRRAQLQRIRTAADRATQEDRRATPHPEDRAFLASGRGTYVHRRVAAASSPLGAADSRRGRRRGAPSAQHPGLPEPPTAGEAPAARGLGADRPVRRGAATARSAPGQVDGRDVGPLGARIAHGRPAVDRGPAATAANVREVRVRDDRDAEQRAASLLQSFVDATTRSGVEEGAGAGGVGGGGAPGVGGDDGAGGLARARGIGGAGSYMEDPRYMTWYRAQLRRVRRALVFPRRRQLAMDQGTTVFRLRVGRDGHLLSSPRLLHTSGFADLDAAARDAIEQALPFGPLPDELVPDRSFLAIRLAVDFQNPMTH